jgi:hypothetical protein
MRKLCRTGSVDADGNVVTIPRLPSVTGAHKPPPGWNRWSAAEKVEHLLGMSLDRMHDYLSWPADGLDPYRLAAQAQVVRVVAMVAAKVEDAVAVLRACGVDLDWLRREVLNYVDNELGNLVAAHGDGAKPTAGLQRVLQRAADISRFATEEEHA